MDNPALIYKPFEAGQEQLVSEMVWDVFCEFEAPDYSEKGVKIFKAFINPQRLAKQVRDNDFRIYCCFEGELLAGILAFRDVKHISLLFVRKSHHRRGIAKKLLETAAREILKADRDIPEMTVNSSPYAVEIYKRLGFTPTGDMQEKDGIIFMPMKKRLI